MKTDPSCPRCGRAVHEPSLWSSAWQCDAHGPVAPLQAVRLPRPPALDLLIDAARVPVWIPWPLPAGWVVTGLADAGDDRSGALATAVALSGPAPLGGVGEMVVIAEDPGIGLGARIAGLDGTDPGEGFDKGPPDAKVRYDGHEVHLWSVDAGETRAVYVGEALASWLWFVLSPADAGMAMCELNALRDLRDLHDGGAGLEPPFGAPSPFLAAALSPAPGPL
ncbi:DUF6758 family protein [Nocardiopsis ansamitocini]|uniref:Uncharacterized protein n=1 Tax=Nocardiopsis ansamitocini TaxID=1670832 RepID=A0A9W6P472_9ACTN|nr:DUF6758 family protein [Nocardiopsis ansamitocini]GLU46776.1 hypothetical protein Nans01_11270 [Nocardiopsis ansamitocini]